MEFGFGIGQAFLAFKYFCFREKIPGGTGLERGYGDVRPWRPSFHASPAVRKGPISSKWVSSQDPFLRKFGNFSLYSLIFDQKFSSQAPKFGNSPFTSPQIWEFSVHKPPLFRGKYQFASSTLRKSGPHTPTWKKLSAPPGGNVFRAHLLCFNSDFGN